MDEQSDGGQLDHHVGPGARWWFLWIPLLLIVAVVVAFDHCCLVPIGSYDVVVLRNDSDSVVTDLRVRFIGASASAKKELVVVDRLNPGDTHEIPWWAASVELKGTWKGGTIEGGGVFYDPPVAFGKVEHPVVINAKGEILVDPLPVPEPPK